MTQMTFGFEAEFEGNVRPLMSLLTANDFAGTDQLHGWHCDCDDYCHPESGYMFRGQTDSSCGGEVISTILSNQDMGAAVEAMLALQEAAVEADAEPSMNAGFHVHVSHGHLNAARKRSALHAYLRWEAHLPSLARGPFQNVRSFNNPLHGELSWMLSDLDSDQWEAVRAPQGFLDINRLDGVARSSDAYTDALRTVHRTALNADRHAWLYLRPRSGVTWEFRLWNATRSAWRMEMFARLSMLFMEPDAHDGLLDAPVGERGLIAVAADNDRRLAELLERQVSFEPPDVTVFSLAA